VRVLLLHTRYRDPGGEDRVVATESRALAEEGLEVHLHETTNPSDTGPTLGALARAPWNGGAAREVQDLVRDLCPDVVHLHNWWFATSPAVVHAVADTGTPLVATVHNYRLSCLAATHVRDGAPCTLCLGGGTLPGVVRRCTRGSALASGVLSATLGLHRRRGTWDRVARFLALSRAQRTILVAGGLPADRTIVKPNTTPDPGPRSTRPSEGTEVVFAGRLVPERGVAELLAAWRTASPDATLLIAGDGPQRPALEAVAPADVVLAGWLAPDELARRVARARALVVPTAWDEPFGLTALEAMAAGTPVLASDRGALPELLGAGGAVTGPGGWPALLGRLDDGVWLDAAGAAGRARYLESFRPEVVTGALVDVYEDVVREARTTRRT
jgi:glycosyltransferase involved in cell wall biosynthesis